MSHPERYAPDARNAIGSSHAGTGSIANGGALYSGAALGRPSSAADYEAKSSAHETQPQLHQIGQRLEGLICRLTDANLSSRMFVSRVAGMRPEPISTEKNDIIGTGTERPTTQAILVLISNLEQRVGEAEYLSRELGRIG